MQERVKFFRGLSKTSNQLLWLMYTIHLSILFAALTNKNMFKAIAVSKP